MLSNKQGIAKTKVICNALKYFSAVKSVYVRPEVLRPVALLHVAENPAD